MKAFLKCVVFVVVLGLFALCGQAQTSSGSIGGHVVDASGSVVSGADVTLVGQETGVTLTTKTQNSGDFVFVDVKPGTYRVIVRADGYKEFKKDNLALSTTARLSAGTITLEVGSVSESVSVSADITPIQTDSAERSGLLDSKQLGALASQSRDFMTLLRTMPGVVGGSGFTQPIVNGSRSQYVSATIDGVNSGDRASSSVNLDDIAEVKVLSSNYQAEYGARTAGAVINLVTKSGTRDFHGTLYYYMRNEAFNANSWFNNYNGQKRPKSRYNTIGGNIGGPVYWPGHFNSDKNKLFFFYSMEYLPNKTPDGLKKFTVPTALERQGDFSQSAVQGKISPDPRYDYINIKRPGAASNTCPVSGMYDPKTGKPLDRSGCYPGNVLPAGAINPSVLALLNLMPLPNFDTAADRAISGGNYNYVTNYSSDRPVHQYIFRVDYNPSERLHMFGRGELQSTDDIGFNSTVNPAPWLIRGNYRTTTPHFSFDVTYSFTPTLVNELSVGTGGTSENNIYAKEELAKITKSGNGYNLGQIYPANNPLNLIPGMAFGGVSSAATVKYDARFPLHDQGRLYSLTDSLTKVWGRHIIKVGIDLQKNHSLQAHHSSGQPEGAFDFGRNTNNPNDSNYAYSNALLGNFNTYSEPNARFDYDPRVTVVDWYTQDQWKVTNKLTLDYGLRYIWAPGLKLKVGGNFIPSLYRPADAPVLYQPKKVGKTTVAVDPTTGQVYPGAYVGLFVPGTGSLSNGAITVNTPHYPAGMVNGNGVLVSPRFGFAYDPFGEGKSVIRGGFGVFYNDGVLTGQEGDMTFNPPVVFNPTQYYGNVDGFQNAGGLIGPPSVKRAIDLNTKPTAIYNMSLGVQQQVGAGIVLDLAYVGTMGRHLSGQQDINTVPYGAHFQKQNQSPAGGVLPDNFFRPYPGYSSINYLQGFLTSNYNSLQAQLTRRFHNGLEFGIAYTWSKSMDYTDSYDGAVPLYDNLREVAYGPGGDDHRHNLVANYLWNLPRASRVWSNFATRAVLDNWQISGIVSYLSGAPEQITFTTKDGADITGGGDGARAYITGDPLANAPHNFKQWFNTGVVHRPSNVTVDPATGAVTMSNGNAPKVSLFDPGVMNFDTALFKNIPIAETRAAVQLRIETYNTFNHPEFNGVDTAAKFDAEGNQINSTFGQINSSGSPRTMQLALRINF
ncbi:MAG TPA: carboxypeptidase regulatory-like domain-containing protein [Edaphobacter sp.]|nr:carboxypeptidase regulatory-like domain-containing protein [Edaphobacter sp.]